MIRSLISTRICVYKTTLKWGHFHNLDTSICPNIVSTIERFYCNLIIHSHRHCYKQLSQMIHRMLLLLDNIKRSHLCIKRQLNIGLTFMLGVCQCLAIAIVTQWSLAILSHWTAANSWGKHRLIVDSSFILKSYSQIQPCTLVIHVDPKHGWNNSVPL